MLSRIRATLGTLSFSAFLVPLIAFIVPFEYKYRNLFRRLAEALTPADYPRHLDPRFFFYPSDILCLIVFGLALWQFRLPLRRLLLAVETRWLTAFFAMMAFSLAVSHYGISAITLWRLVPLLCPILLACALSQLPAEKMARHVLLAIWTIGLFESCLALYQYFAQHSMGLPQLMEPLDLDKLAAIVVPGGSRWIFDTASASDAFQGVIRSTGTLPHPNVLGGILLATLVSVFPLYTTASSSRFRRLLALSLIPIIFAFFTTYCRAAIFGFIVAAAIWFFKSRPFTARHRRIALIFLLVTGVSFTLLLDQYIHRGGVVNYSPTARGSDRGRIGMMLTAVAMIQEYPLLGVGYNMYDYYLARFVPKGYEEGQNTVHNIYLLIASEGGLITLALFSLFILLLLWRGLRTRLSPEGTALYALLFTLLFMGMLDLAPFFAHQERVYMFLAAGLVASLIREKQTPQRVLDQLQPARPNRTPLAPPA